MTLFLIHALATYVLWSGVFQSSLPLLSGLRDKLASKNETFYRFVSCPLCSGFWCSLAVALVRVPLVPVGELMAVALAGAATTFIIESVLTRYMEK